MCTSQQGAQSYSTFKHKRDTQSYCSPGALDAHKHCLVAAMAHCSGVACIKLVYPQNAHQRSYNYATSLHSTYVMIRSSGCIKMYMQDIFSSPASQSVKQQYTR